MAQITQTTEPRTSLLVAVFFTGAALQLCALKGYVPAWVAIGGQWLSIGSIAWQLARAWYMRKSAGAEGLIHNRGLTHDSNYRPLKTE